MAEHARVHAAAAPYLLGAWPWVGPDAWTPDVTLAMNLDATQIGVAVAAALPYLPLTGQLDHGGVEDAATGWRHPLWSVDAADHAREVQRSASSGSSVDSGAQPGGEHGG